MQKHLSLLQDVRGCMTQFDPLTPEIVAAQSEDGLTYDELKQVLEECGMDIEKVVFDGTRAFQNAFYADFEHGTTAGFPSRRRISGVSSAPWISNSVPLPLAGHDVTMSGRLST